MDMRLRRFGLLFALATAATISPSRALAQWALNGAQVYTTYAQYPHLISDASGGAYIFADGFPSALLTRLNSSGAVATGWPLEGVTLSNGSGEDNRVVSACLNADGGITAFVGDVGNWCARYSADGHLMPGWPRLQITATKNYAVQVFPLIAGRNLLLIPTETDLVASGTGLRALSLEVDGTVTPGWPDSGRMILPPSATGDSGIVPNPGLRCPDGGIWLPIVKYNRNQNHALMNSFITRFNPDGTVDSSFGGGRYVFAPPPADAGAVRMAPDGAGGFFCTWVDDRTGISTHWPESLASLDIYLTHITASGQVAPGWPSAGLPVCVWPGEQNYPAIAPDASGGAFVLWTPNGPQGNTVHAQHVLGNGTIAPGWPVNGKAMFPPFAYSPTSVVSDGLGGAFVAADGYDATGEGAVKAQHVNGQGDFDNSWSAPGYLLDNTTTALRDDASMIPAGPGSAYVTWTRDGIVYAQKMVVGGVVSANAALVSADATSDRVALEWFVSGDRLGTAAVDRRVVDGEWGTLASVSPDGAGHVRYEDHAVTPGLTYEYRLSWPTASGRDFSAASSIHVPLQLAFALAGARPNPASSRDCRIAYSLAQAGMATLELYDVRGRRVAMLAVGSRGIGEQLASFGRVPAAVPGIYWVRLRQGHLSATARLVMTE